MVTGSSYGRFKRSGTINGTRNHKSQLWDREDDPDTFRIKICEEDDLGNETVIYDNGSDQDISGGSIAIHAKKRKRALIGAPPRGGAAWLRLSYCLLPSGLPVVLRASPSPNTQGPTGAVLYRLTCQRISSSPWSNAVDPYRRIAAPRV